MDPPEKYGRLTVTQLKALLREREASVKGKKKTHRKVSAINDPAIDLEYMCYLIKFDSTHGRFSGTVSHEADEIKVNDRPVKVFHHKSPADIPWREAGVQYVIEASGMFTSVDKASLHLSSDGVRRVIVTGPSADAPMLIMGVNENTIQPEMKVISCASSTLYCLAPIVKILEDLYGVADGFVTSIHAMTPSLRPLDGLCVRGKHWRDHRSIHQNIIPAATGACRALGRIVPACAGRLAGVAFRVPVVSGSVLDLTVRLNKDTTVAEISNAIDRSENRSLRNIIQTSKEKTVSSDFAGDTHSCTLDTNSSLQITPNFFKLICWYENEYSYSCRVIETVMFLDRQFQAQVPTCSRIMYMRPSTNVHNLDNCQGDVLNQYLSFCVPNLQYNHEHLKSGSRKFEMKPSTDCPIHQVGRLPLPEKKYPIKSYIEQLRNCKCNETQNKIDVLRKDSSKDNEHAKAENCLKNVEKEISDMLNIAEDLLNKSSSKKLHTVKKTMNISENQLENRNIMRKEFIAKISDTLEKIRKVKKDAEDTDVIADEKTILFNIDNFQNKVLPASKAISPKNSDLKLPKPNLPTNIANSNVSQKLNTYKIYPCPSITECTNGPNYLTIAVKSEYPHDVHEKDSPTTVTTIVSEKLEKTLNILNVTTPGKSEVSDPIQNKYNEDTTTSIDNNQSGKKINAYENKGLIKIVISNSNFKIVKKPESKCTENVEQQCIELLETISKNKMYGAKNDNDNIEKVQSGKNLENIMNSPGCSISSTDNNSDKSSFGVSSSTVPTLSKNNSSFRNTQDIYDKLDSESMSDSGSSNRIREKTSQVINITDLTYSLEDLPRLDKICRVIEISDELSDKLFSPLDDNSENMAKKKWSFKDMCERIKFDDFCDELFEKSAS